MVKNVKIRILALFMAVTLSFCICSNEYYDVKALEWVVPVVGFDTAIKFLLGLLGIATTVEVGSNVDWEEVKNGCVNYQIEQGNSAVAVSKWWDNVISGTLDTASSVWTSFKDWVKNELLSNSSNGDVSVIPLDILRTVFPNLQSYTPSSLDEYNIKYAYYSININQPNILSVAFFNDEFAVDAFTSGDNQYIRFYSPTSSRPIYFHADNYNVNATSITFGRNAIYSTVLSSNYQFYLYGVDDSLINLHDYYYVWDGISVPSESDFESAFDNISDIALAPDVATDIPIEGDITIPWENVGETDTAIDTAIDDALDRVHSGSWSLDQYWSWVQNVTNIFAYDITNNYLLPNDGDDEKADDKIQQNINRGAMVLYGLEKVFPFCIPWDIYAFVNLLVADPVAPVIEYPIYNPVYIELI